jgi:hypothetical protein
MTGKDVEIPVELSGGPLDGHRDAVAPREEGPLDVYLFGKSVPLPGGAVEKTRYAYKWANRTTARGRRWVLEFHCVVSRWIIGKS